MKLLKQLIDEFLISLCLYLYFFNCFSNTLPECHTLLLRKDAMLLILRQLRDLSGVRATKGVHENNVHGIGITMLTHIQQKKNIYIRCIQLQKERAGRPSHRSYETATSPLLQDWKSQISWSRTSSCVAVTIEWSNAETTANFPDGMILSVTGTI